MVRKRGESFVLWGEWLWGLGWVSQSLGSRAGPFKDIKQLQGGREQSVLPARGRQDIKWV